ncbi:hypothetical protein [Actinomadura opuntiae]|uniref:hypothetical protein n=1 Tax=Actinomadura sp. OS1-43 TaxID=604315 RepID=UPI00255AE1A0|nr:hypothetical protein [Actinomadura sp. OS1-43]MDL4821216.1 hypothetical protein [Actinomadura sp. OS1-43]
MSADQDDPSAESGPARPAPDDVLVAGGPPRRPASAPPQADTTVADGLAVPGGGTAGTTSPDGFPARSGYTPQDGYAPHDGYAPQDAHPAQTAPQAGYAQHDAYPPQDGFEFQDGYAPGWDGDMGQGPVPPQGPGIPGMPLPPGIGGPQPRGGKLKKRLVTGAGVAAVVAAAATVAMVFVHDDEGPGKPRPKPSSTAPAAWALKAGRQLTSGPGFHYRGTLTGANGAQIQADLQVTTAGSAVGTLTAGALKADVVAVDGETYIKAGLGFWREYAGERSHPENFAGRWSKAPAAVPGFDVPDVLGAQAIAESLTKAAANPPTQTVNGVRTYRIAAKGATYLVSAEAPYRLLGVQAAGTDGARFSVADLPDAGTLFTRLRPRVKALAGAADPNLHFDPGTLTFVDCDQNTAGCTVRVPATLSAPQAVPDGARAALRASIATRGTALGSCAASAPVPSDRSLVLSCTVTGRAWRTWVKSALDHPGSYPYSAQARVIGEALTRADVRALLAKVDRERSKMVKSSLSGASGSPSPGTGGH